VTCDFVLQHTHPRRLPAVPELLLHLGDEITQLWRILTDRLGNTDAAPPYWAFAWVGGQALARYLLDHPPEVAGRRVTDFAAGSGLCGIAAMKAGAASVLAADIDPFCGDAIASNADANDVRVAFTDRDLLDAAPPDTDVILAGDICYEGPLATRVLAWLHEAHTRGTRVLIGDPGRAYFPRESMIRLTDYQVPASRDLEDVEVKAAGVFTFADAAR